MTAGRADMSLRHGLKLLLPLVALAAAQSVRAQEAGGSGGGRKAADEEIVKIGRPQIEPHRWEEDWRYLCDRALRPEPLDRLKCLRLGRSTTLTLSGELRERFETVVNPGFGIGRSSENVLLHRSWLGADLRFGDTARAFAEVGYLDQTGREGEPVPTDVNRLDVLQAFFDISASIAGGQATLRAGRMEMTLGSQRLVALRDGPNARNTFNGARAFWERSDYRFDAFFVRPTGLTRGMFDDDADGNERFWGVYGTAPMAGPLNADIFYLGYWNRAASFAAGEAREGRHSVGLRLFGASNRWDWDMEGVYQFGEFGSRRIRAWMLSSDDGFTFESAPFKPRLGAKADIASGDSNLGNQTLGTFNPLFPKQPYFSEANLATQANIMDLHPSLEVKFTSNLTVGVGAIFQWRHRREDGIYLASLQAVEGGAGGSERYIGTQLVADVDWKVTPQLTLRTQYVHFERGSALRGAGGRDVKFLVVSAQFKF